MTRPGDRLHALAARLCSERTRQRLTDPAIADLQAEIAAARRTGSSWRTLRAMTAGYLSIAKVLAIALAGDLMREAVTWQPEERIAARGGALVAIAATIASTALMVAGAMGEPGDAGEWARLGLYLTPSTIPMTVPLGLMLGVAWTFHGVARTRKLASAALAIAVLAALGMLANLAWLTPDANQAYRELRVPAHFRAVTDAPLIRGFNELTPAGMRARLQEMRTAEPPRVIRRYEAAYYRKFAVGVVAVPAVSLMLALALRRRWGRARLTVAAVAMVPVYAAALIGGSALDVALPPVVAGWFATALVAVAAMAATLTPPRVRA